MNISTIEDIVSAAKLLDKSFGVVSTVDPDGKPEAAFVYFVIDDELNVYFATRAKSRKYKNIAQNPHVAFVIASERPPQTIQIEGTAEVVTGANEQHELFSKLIDVLREGGYAAPVTTMMDCSLEFIKINTTWARLGDFEVVRGEESFHEVTK